MRISDQYLVQGPYDGNAVLVDDSTGAEERISLEIPDVAVLMAKLRKHPAGQPFAFGAIAVPPNLLPGVCLALGYLYRSAADEARAAQ